MKLIKLEGQWSQTNQAGKPNIWAIILPCLCVFGFEDVIYVYLYSLDYKQMFWKENEPCVWMNITPNYEIELKSSNGDGTPACGQTAVHFNALSIQCTIINISLIYLWYNVGLRY
jgi:hypothetical protein